MTHLELVFVYNLRKGVTLLHVDIQLFLYHLLKRQLNQLNSLSCLGIFDILESLSCGFIFGLSILFH